MTDCNPTILKAELKSLSVINERLNCEIGNLKIELESLRQENSRLREALGEIASDGEFIRDCSPMHLAMIANRALNPPKRS